MRLATTQSEQSSETKRKEFVSSHYVKLAKSDIAADQNVLVSPETKELDYLIRQNYTKLSNYTLKNGT